MRAALVVLGVLACPACDHLFTLTQVPDVDAAIDAEIDALPSCENPTPFGSECRTLTLPITNDTFISEAEADVALGTRDAMMISSSVPALLKFDTSQIAADERIAALTLAIDPKYSQQAKACSSTNDTCEVCPAPGLGAWELFWMRTDWNDAQATWNNRAGASTSWALPGAASVPEDHSGLIATGAPPSGGGLLSMTVSEAQLLAHSPDCYRTQNQLALRVTIEGVAWFDVHEGSACTTGSPPTLAVTVCRNTL